MHPVRRRILIFLPQLTLGGAERQGLILAKHLQSLGHDVEVWGFPPVASPPTLVPELEASGLLHRTLARWPSVMPEKELWYGRIRRTLWRTLEWPRQVRQDRALLPEDFAPFDVVIPCTFWPSLMAGLWREELGAKTVYWGHVGGVDAAGIQYTPWLIRRILKGANRFIANSAAGARFLDDTLGLPSGTTQVRRNAWVEENPLQDAVDAQSSSSSRGADAAMPQLIHVANLYPEKDLETVLDAVALLAARGMPCRLNVVGRILTEAHRAALLSRVDALGITAQVVFHGQLSGTEVRRLSAKMTAGVLSSRSEGCPNAVMEYMARGLPVVATDIPATRELLDPSQHRWLVPVGDADAMAQAMARLLASDRLRSEATRINRARVTNEFAIDRALRSWVEEVVA